LSTPRLPLRMTKTLRQSQKKKPH